MGRSAQRRWILLWLAGALGLGGVAGADSAESFKRGIAATDLEQWAEAVRHLRQAVAENPRESEERIFLSGVFSRPYLPHFYLGWALFNQGSEQCEEALEHWELSLGQGVVMGFKRQHRNLLAGRERCREILLPAAAEGAEKALARADASADRLPAPLSDPALESERARGRRELEEVRGELAAARSASDLAGVREARRRAQAVTEGLNAVIARIESAESDSLAVAVATARQTLLTAERSRDGLARLLAAPSHAELRQTHPELTLPADAEERLEAARQRLASAASAAEANAAREAAETARARFEAVRQAVDRAYADFVERLRLRAASGGSRPALKPGPVIVAPPPPPPARESRPLAPAPPPASSPAASGALDALKSAAERLLAAVGSEASGSELLETQKSRLTLLILEARESGGADAASLAALEDRLAGSLAALRLVAGARAYLAGDPAAALAFLEGAAPADDRLAAQAHLFAAASRFALYLRGGGAALRRQALRDVTASRRLDPDLSPDPAVFSPHLRELFERAAGAR